MKGIFSALFNTFKSDGSPDIEALEKIIDYNINVCGVDGLYVNGSTGENFNMPHEYKKTMLRAAAKHNAGRITLIAQIGSTVVEEIHELADIAYECRYNAISAVTPYYYVYSAESLMNFYTELADYSKLPLVIYNIPVRTGVSLSRAQFGTLLSHKNIAGVKFTHNDFYLLESIRSDHPNKLIYSGFDEMLLSAAVLGTDGAIGTTYNLIGDWAKKVFESAKACDLETARRYQHLINEVVGMMFETDMLPTCKAMFTKLGIEAGSCRPPMQPTGKAQLDNAERINAFVAANR